jgi:hypothetical protein
MLGISGNWLAVEMDYSASNEIAGEQIDESDNENYN